MFRKDLIPILRDNPMTLTELAEVFGASPKELADDFQHLLKSLKHTADRAVVSPAICRRCGFEFGPDKLRKPSKCPRCHSTWLSEPRLEIRSRKT